jgi:hypothetical protein
MKKDMLFSLVAIVLAYGCFLFGRRFPAHHYEHLAGFDRGEVHFLLVDTATGKVCDAMKPFQEKAIQAIRAHAQANMERWDKEHPNQSYASSPVFAQQEGMSWDEYDQRAGSMLERLLGKVVPPSQFDYVPACGKE